MTLLIPGAHILDTCSSDTYALEQTMEFIISALSTADRSRGDYVCDDGSPPKHSGNQSVIGVIGAASSPVSAMVANILRLFHVSKFELAIIRATRTGAEVRCAISPSRSMANKRC